MKFKIKTVKNIPQGFIGLNYKAARSHNIKYKYPKSTILLKRGLSHRIREHTLRHEKIELELMKMGIPYHTAHGYALKHERDKFK